MGAAMLKAIGMDELIAGDEERYVVLACDLARNAARRMELSGRIREKMAGRPSFLDSEGYARRVAAAFEAMLAERGFA
jgi:predicted O-linked N-acetylglucosamine transferase (SPINDLY family)